MHSMRIIGIISVTYLNLATLIACAPGDEAAEHVPVTGAAVRSSENQAVKLNESQELAPVLPCKPVSEEKSGELTGTWVSMQEEARGTESCTSKFVLKNNGAFQIVKSCGSLVSVEEGRWQRCESHLLQLQIERSACRPLGIVQVQFGIGTKEEASDSARLGAYKELLLDPEKNGHNPFKASKFSYEDANTEETSFSESTNICL